MAEVGTTEPHLVVNGAHSGVIDARDRGLALGDGVFETIRVQGGDVTAWPYHLARLDEGATALGFAAPRDQTLLDDCRAAIGSAREGTLRLTVTRGAGPRGYAPPADPTPTRIAAFYPGLPAPTTHQLSLCWCSTRLASQPQLAGIKHLNRLEQVLARAEWSDGAIDEGVMQAADGRVIECTSANLFCVRDGRVVTPSLPDCGVAGVMRRRVIEAARGAGWPVDIRAVETDELAAADEVFITSSIRGVAGVARLGDSAFRAPGPVTADLAGRLEGRA